MSELIRILSNKRRLALLFALPLVTVALFLFERMGGEIIQAERDPLRRNES